MNRAVRNLWHHSRDIICWFNESKASYVIPQHFSTEKILGRNLEVQIDLEKPGKYYILEKTEYKTILKAVDSLPSEFQEKIPQLV
jgi:hypothetical protein